MIISYITTKKLSQSTGSSQRSLVFYNAIKKSGAKVYLFCFTNSESSVSKKFFINRYTVAFNSIIKSLKYFVSGKVPYIERLRNINISEKQLKIIFKSDILHLEEHDAFYVIEKYLQQYKGKIILNAHNIDYLKFKSEIYSKNVLVRIFGRHLVNIVKEHEKRIIKLCDLIIVCSNLDKQIYSKIIDPDKIVIIFNGVFIRKKINRVVKFLNSILFIGNLEYAPNGDSLKYYLSKIHPLVKRKYPDIKLIIVGRSVPSWLAKYELFDKSVYFCGYIRNLNKLAGGGYIGICPIRHGSGTRMKILQYMALNIPVVSTTKGSEGLNITNKKNIYISDTPESFSKYIVYLIENRKNYNRVRLNAFNLVQKYYDWKKISGLITSLYLETP